MSPLIDTTPPAFGDYRRHEQQSAENQEKQHAPPLCGFDAAKREVQGREDNQQSTDFAPEFFEALSGEGFR
jgi:hypothetical protein